MVFAYGALCFGHHDFNEVKRSSLFQALQQFENSLFHRDYCINYGNIYIISEPKSIGKAPRRSCVVRVRMPIGNGL